MTTTGTDFTRGFGARGGAEAYDEVLIPRLFTPCALILLARLELRPGETLLDIACGTGIVVRLAAPIIGPGGRVLGRDINEAMLVRARSHQLPPDSPAVELGVAPAAPLDLGDGGVDAVTCQQGLQFFPDPDAAVAEMRRCLRPGGRVAIAVWRGVEECPLWGALEVAFALFGADRASAVRVPFSWPGEDALVAVLRGARLTEVVTSTHTVVMHFDGSLRQAARSLAATPFAADVAALDGAAYERMLQTTTEHLGQSATPDDPVDLPARTLVATAVRP